MLGAVDVRRPQIAHQQMVGAEHVKRQETVAVVVAMKEAANLAPVHRIIGGVEVEHQFLGRGLERGDEGLDHRHMRRPRPTPIRRPVETADRRWAGQPLVASERRLQRQVVAQRTMVVDVFMAQRHRVHPLT